MDKDMLSRLSSEKGTVLVEFYATWCPHCRKMMPVVENVKSSLEGKVPVYQFDIDKEPALSDELKVEVVPTFMVFKDGEMVWKTSGEIDGNMLYSKAEENM